MYLGILTAGIVGILGSKVELPKGLDHGLLGAGFALNWLLMSLHAKHEPMDAILHQLLGGIFLVRCDQHCTMYTVLCVSWVCRWQQRPVQSTVSLFDCVSVDCRPLPCASGWRWRSLSRWPLA